MSVIVQLSHARVYDTTRAELSAAIAAAGVVGWVLSEEEESHIRTNFTKILGHQSFRLGPMPFAESYPCIWCRVGAGDIMLQPYSSGSLPGWIATLAPSVMSNTGGAPLTLVKNTEQFLGIPVVAPTAESAAFAAIFYATTLRSYETVGELYFAPGGPVYRAVPQIAAKKKAA